METKSKYVAILPVRHEPNGCLPAFVVPRLLRIEDAAQKGWLTRESICGVHLEEQGTKVASATSSFYLFLLARGHKICSRW